MPGRCRKFTPPRNIPPDVVEAIKLEALRAFKALGFRSYGRIDGFYLADGRILITDPNSASGMAPSSFFFEQAACAGMLPSMIISRLIESALDRRMMNIPLLLLLLAMAGCAAVSAIGDGSPEEMKKAEMSKDDLWNQTKALEKEKADYQKRLADQQEELARVAKDLSDQQTEIARANKQVAELNKSVDELNTQMRQTPGSPAERTAPEGNRAGATEEGDGKAVKKIKSPKKQVRKASPKVKTQEPKTADTSAIVKQITDAKQKLSAGKEEPETPPGKKEAETPREKITEKKQEAQPGAPAVKTREPRPLDDLSLRMKLFEEAGEKESTAKETRPAQVKKGARKGDKAVKAPKQIARKEPAKMTAAGTKGPHDQGSRGRREHCFGQESVETAGKDGLPGQTDRQSPAVRF